MTRRGLLLFWGVIVCLASHSLRAADPGESGAAFLKLGVGARGLGLAGAHSASASGVEALFWNPAGLGGAAENQVILSYNPLVEGVDAAHAAGLVSFEKGAVGFGFFSLSHEDIDGFDGAGNSNGKFEAADSAALLSFERGKGNLKWGLTGKLIRSEIAGQSASAFAGDAGIQIRNPWSEKITHSLVARNIGGGLTFVREEEDLPSVFMTGLSLHLVPSFRLNLEGGTEAGVPGGMAGSEWRPLASGKDVLAFRAGYSSFKNKIDGLSGLSFGAGFEAGSAEWDYAWIPFGELGNAHSVSLTWKFGEKADQSFGSPINPDPVKSEDIGEFVDGAWVEMNDGRRFQGRIIKETPHFFILGTHDGRRKVRKDRISRLRRIPIRVKGNLGSVD